MQYSKQSEPYMLVLCYIICSTVGYLSPYIQYSHLSISLALQHDSTSECTPGGSQGNYIMFPSATDGTLPNNRLFSPCSQESIGRTIEIRGDCFIPR